VRNPTTKVCITGHNLTHPQQSILSQTGTVPGKGKVRLGWLLIAVGTIGCCAQKVTLVPCV
jgi:hypothetical protein